MAPKRGQTTLPTRSSIPTLSPSPSWQQLVDQQALSPSTIPEGRQRRDLVRELSEEDINKTLYSSFVGKDFNQGSSRKRQRLHGYRETGQEKERRRSPIEIWSPNASDLPESYEELSDVVEGTNRWADSDRGSPTRERSDSEMNNNIELDNPGDPDDADDNDDNEVLGSNDGSDVDRRRDRISKRVLKKAAEKLVGLLSGTSFNGCSEAEHTIKENNHYRSVQAHFPISTTYDKLPETTGAKGERVGLAVKGFPINNGEDRNQFVDTNELRWMEEGTAPNEEGKRNVCIHESHKDGIGLQVQVDLDSLCIQHKSLRRCKSLWKWVPTRHEGRNIQSSLKNPLRVQVEGKHGIVWKNIELRDLPHLWVGEFADFLGCQIYYVAPSMYFKGRSNNYWNNEDISLFHDEAMLPACRIAMSSGNRQYMPGQWDTAELDAGAKGKETGKGTYGIGHKQGLTYTVQPTAIAQFFSEVDRAIAKNPRLAKFRSGFWIINSKNTKSEWKTDGSLLEAMRKMKSKLESTLDIANAIDATVDIGREMIQKDPHSRYQKRIGTCEDGQARVFLWKTCCLEKIYSQLVDECFGGENGSPPTKGKLIRYIVGLLRDAGCMGLIPPKRSWIWKAGLRYLQLYCACKTVGDAATTFHFGEDSLVQLAVDAATWNASRRGAGISNMQTFAALIEQWSSTKERVLSAWRGEAAVRSYGARLEARMTWELFVACLDELEKRADSMAEHDEAVEDDDVAESSTDSQSEETTTPSSVWSIPTDVWAEYMINNYNKYVTIVETAAITSSKWGIPWKRSVFMAMNILKIKVFSNVDPYRYSVLSRAFDGSVAVMQDAEVDRSIDAVEDDLDSDSDSDVSGNEVYSDAGMLREEDELPKSVGIGVMNSVQKWGFGWNEVEADWEKFELKVPTDWLKQIKRAKNLLGWLKKSSVVCDLDARLEVCIERLQQLAKSRESNGGEKKKVFDVMSHLICCQLRRDWAKSLSGERRRLEDGVLAYDEIVFCYSGVARAFTKSIHLVDGNRARVKSPEYLLDWYFGTSDRSIFDKGKIVRTSFENNHFRRMYLDVVMSYLANNATHSDIGRFKEIFKDVLFTWQTLLLYPIVNGTLLSTATKALKQYEGTPGGGQGMRKWIAVGKLGGTWKVLGKDARKGYPPPYPDFLYIDDKEFEDYIGLGLDV